MSGLVVVRTSGLEILSRSRNRCSPRLQLPHGTPGGLDRLLNASQIPFCSMRAEELLESGEERLSAPTSDTLLNPGMVHWFEIEPVKPRRNRCGKKGHVKFCKIRNIKS